MLASALVVPSCNTDPAPPEDATDDTGTGSTTFQPATGAETVAVVATTTTGETGVLDEDSGPGPGGGECSFFLQDCNEGEKCVPWSQLPDLVPDEIRCCPVQQPMVEAGDICSVAGYLGSCLDNCAPGTMCLDIDGDGEGVCQKMCEGSEEQPECPQQDDTCFIYYSGVPLCFRTCDPLVQDCPADKGCYPDAIAEGGTGFLCMPTVGDNGLGDYCWLLSACNPGMICATAHSSTNCSRLIHPARSTASVRIISSCANGPPHARQPRRRKRTNRLTSESCFTAATIWQSQNRNRSPRPRTNFRSGR